MNTPSHHSFCSLALILSLHLLLLRFKEEESQKFLKDILKYRRKGIFEGGVVAPCLTSSHETMSYQSANFDLARNHRASKWR
jgi:hypothetical protein